MDVWDLQLLSRGVFASHGIVTSNLHLVHASDHDPLPGNQSVDHVTISAEGKVPRDFTSWNRFRGLLDFQDLLIDHQGFFGDDDL